MPTKLYDLDLSTNCYKVRLFAALAAFPLEIVPIDFFAGAHKCSPLIDLNPWGEIPILEDGALVLRDSQAILVYLAAKHGKSDWCPVSPAGQGEIMQWLSVAANELQHGPFYARLIALAKLQVDKAPVIALSERILGLVDAQLAYRDWLACGRPTIADRAVFPSIALAYQGGVSLDPYPKLRAWVERVKALPGFVGMPGLE